MIKISMKRFNKVVELKLPTEHEHVMVSLWKLGLQRDPAKYTLRELNAVISYDTAWEHQMTSLVSVNDTLQDTLMLLQHMMAPPEPIAAGLRAGVVAGVYKTGKAFLTDLEMQVDKNAVYEATMYFPLSGEIVDAKQQLRSQQKPDCPLIGADGNIFNLMGIASQTLREHGQADQAKEMCERIHQSGSYDAALCIMGEYVNITAREQAEQMDMQMQ